MVSSRARLSMASSEIWRRSSRKCAVIPSAPAAAASRAARNGSGYGAPRAFRIVATWSIFTPRRSRVMVTSRESTAPRLYSGGIAQMRREFVGFPGGHLHRGERDEFHANLCLAAGAIDQTRGRNRLAAGGADRFQAFARRDAGRDDVFHHQHRLVLFKMEIAAELELAVDALDIHRRQTELAAHLIAWHDAANRRRHDGREFRFHFFAHLGGERLAELRGPLGILEHQRLLQEGVGVQPARQDEMAFEQRACLLEFRKYLFVVHWTCSLSRTRSTDSTAALTRSAPMMFCKWATSRTSMSTRTSKNSALRCVTFMLKMLPPFEAITVIAAASDPGTFLVRTRMRATLGPASAACVLHATSSQSSISVSARSSSSQSTVWMTAPSPGTIRPTMRSPGSGWQHWPSLYEMPSLRPRMEIGLRALAGSTKAT